MAVFKSSTNRQKWIFFAIIVYSMVYMVVHFHIDDYQSAVLKSEPQLTSENWVDTHGMQIIPYAQVRMMNKSSAFFKHFSNLYPNLNWNLYDYHWLPEQDQLLMVSIPPHRKATIIQQLYNSSINILDLWLRRHNQILEYGPLVDPRHNVLYCNIPKVATTKFQTLLFGFNQNISFNLNHYAKDIWLKQSNKWIKGNPESVKHKIFKKPFAVRNLSEYLSILSSEQWTKFVIVRDPLSRSISAYDDKCNKRKALCMNGNEKKPKRKRVSISYYEWLHNLQYLMQQNQHKVLWNRSKTELQEQRHCGLTKYFCELELFLPYYDYIILYNKEYIGLPTKYMIEHMRNRSLAHFYYNWDSQNNDTMFSRYTTHSISSSKEEQHDLFAKYFSNEEVLQKALQVYAKDYMYLPFDTPTS
eukprot:172993_1